MKVLIVNVPFMLFVDQSNGITIGRRQKIAELFTFVSRDLRPYKNWQQEPSTIISRDIPLEQTINLATWSSI
jgi:hypothetical protein